MGGTNTRIYVARSGTSATQSTAVALLAATPKTVVSVLGTASDTLGLKRVRVSFNSVTATDAPALVEVGFTSANGTGTAFTPVQVSGATLASSAVALYNHSAEPTYLRIFDSTYVPVNNGVMEWWYPLSEEPQTDPSQGLAIRITSPAAASVYASLLYAE